MASIVRPRSDWGPIHDNGAAVIGTAAWANGGYEIRLHHSVTGPLPENATIDAERAHMRTLEKIGEDEFGSGISYTWVVFPSGRVWQGHDVDRQGTHTYMRNDRARAICLVGNYEVQAPGATMLNAVAALTAELQHPITGGHRDVYPTACPGIFAYARIRDINTLAASGTSLEEDDLAQVPQWQWERVMDRVLRQSAGVEGQNPHGPQYLEEANWRRRMEEQAAAQTAQLTAMAKAFAAMASSPDITPESMRKMLVESYAGERAAIARAVAAETIDALAPMLHDLLGEDNAAQADAVVVAIGDRLAARQAA